ncbi:hypothetical protein RJ639_026145, partial [Escallonia herrerae]
YVARGVLENGDGTVTIAEEFENDIPYKTLSHSFLLSADDYPELTPNSIYFTDDWGVMSSCGDYGPPADYPYEGHDMGVYHLEDCSVTHHYHPSRLEKKLTRPPPCGAVMGIKRTKTGLWQAYDEFHFSHKEID